MSLHCTARYTRQSSGQIVAAVQSIFYWPWLRTAQNGVQVREGGWWEDLIKRRKIISTLYVTQTIIYCAVEESLEDQTGLYYEVKPTSPSLFNVKNNSNLTELFHCSSQ